MIKEELKQKGIALRMQERRHREKKAIFIHRELDYRQIESRKNILVFSDSGNGKKILLMLFKATNHDV
jgi:D-arabinose 5-phosphate isomerase GutQ